MKEIYESINWSKVDGSVKAQFDSIKSDTENFSDADMIGVYQENFDELVGIVKSKNPEAMGGKAPAKPTEKKVAKPAKARKRKSPRKKGKKAKASKKKKDVVLFKGKPVSQADCDDLIREYQKRREASKKSSKKSQTKSIFEKVTDKVEGVVAQAIKSVGAEAISKDPKAFSDKVDKIADATKEYLQKFKSILGDEYDSSEVQDVVKHIEALADKIRSKAKKKMSDGGSMATGGVVYLDGIKGEKFKTNKALREFVRNQATSGVKKVEVDYENRIIPTFDTWVIEDGKLIHKGEFYQPNYDKAEAERKRVETERSINKMMGYESGGSMAKGGEAGGYKTFYLNDGDSGGQYFELFSDSERDVCVYEGSEDAMSNLLSQIVSDKNEADISDIMMDAEKETQLIKVDIAKLKEVVK